MKDCTKFLFFIAFCLFNFNFVTGLQAQQYCVPTGGVTIPVEYLFTNDDPIALAPELIYQNIPTLVPLSCDDAISFRGGLSNGEQGYWAAYIDANQDFEFSETELLFNSIESNNSISETISLTGFSLSPNIPYVVRFIVSAEPIDDVCEALYEMGGKVVEQVVKTGREKVKVTRTRDANLNINMTIGPDNEHKLEVFVSNISCEIVNGFSVTGVKMVSDVKYTNASFSFNDHLTEQNPNSMSPMSGPYGGQVTFRPHHIIQRGSVILRYEYDGSSVDCGGDCETEPIAVVGIIEGLNKPENAFDAIINDGEGVLSISSFPTTVIGDFTVKYNLPNDSNINLNLYNQTGNLVQRLQNNIEATKGVSTFNFSIPDLPKGLYYLHLQTDNGNKVLPMIKR